MTDDVIGHLEREHDAILERLKAVLRLPSVSTDPAYADGMRAARQHFMDRLKAIGLEDVQLLDGGGHPAVYGSWEHAPGAPTVIIYGQRCAAARADYGKARRSSPRSATADCMHAELRT